MVSELSILIPVYNYNVTTLVKTLHQQCQALPIHFEIRLYDDGSTAEIKEQNSRGLRNLSHTQYIILTNHLGRSAIRNILAQDALYEYILFLDNDSEIVSQDYIRNYLQVIKEDDIIIGGTIYSQDVPPLAYRLHWQYGRNREQRSAAQRNKLPYNSFHLNNIILPKAITLLFPLQELQYGYGHEDSLFGKELREARIKVKHIDNPVLHMGLEETKVYLEKTKEAVLNLHYLYRHKKVGSEIKLIKLYELLLKSHILPIFVFVYSSFEKAFVKQLRSEKPSLRLLDMYKLYYFTSAESSSLSARS